MTLVRLSVEIMSRYATVWHVTFAEKLAKLTEGRDKRKLSVDLGLPATAVSNYISKGNTPRSDTALKLARALEVPVDWLIDDARGFPLPQGERPTVQSVPDPEFLGELGRRYWIRVQSFSDALDAAERLDWGRAEQLLKGASSSGPMPSELSPYISACSRLVAEYLHAFMLQPESIIFNWWHLYVDDPAKLKSKSWDVLEARNTAIWSHAGFNAMRERLGAMRDAAKPKQSSDT